MASTPSLSTPAAAGFQLAVPADVLRPLVQAVVAEVMHQLDAARATLPDKLAFTEEEAARLLSLNTWQLRDARLHGKIASSKITGGRVRYSRADLERYLMEGRSSTKGARR